MTIRDLRQPARKHHQLRAQQPDRRGGRLQLPHPTYPTNLQLQQALRPFPQLSGIDSNASGQNDGHSTYHALETSFEHRFSKGLYLMATYTVLQTDLDFQWRGRQSRHPGRGAEPVQPAARQGRGLQRRHPHNIHIGYTYDLPIAKGQALLNHMPRVVNGIFGNWKVSGIQTYVSGTPLWISCSQNFFGAGNNARCSFARGATTGQILLINPAWTWSHDNMGTTALGKIPYLNPAAFILSA